MPANWFRLRLAAITGPRILAVQTAYGEQAVRLNDGEVFQELRPSKSMPSQYHLVTTTVDFLGEFFGPDVTPTTRTNGGKLTSDEWFAIQNRCNATLPVYSRDEQGQLTQNVERVDDNAAWIPYLQDWRNKGYI